MPDTLKCPACGDPLEPHWHDGLRAAGVWTCPNCVEDGRRPPMDDDHGRTGEETISLNYLVRDGRILRGTEALIAAKGLRMEAEMEHRFADRCLLEALKDAGMQHTADTYMDGSEGRRVVVRMITDAELREWEALCQKATKGPWELEDSDGIHAIPTDRMIVSYAEDCAFIEEADARFCAAARTAMPKLIAEVRRLQGEVQGFRLLFRMDPLTLKKPKGVRDETFLQSLMQKGDIERYEVLDMGNRHRTYRVRLWGTSKMRDAVIVEENDGGTQ